LDAGEIKKKKHPWCFAMRIRCM